MKEWWIKFGKSFYYAGRGIMTGFRERNMIIHCLMAVIVIIMGWIFSLSLMEWSIVLILIGLVIFAELVNTSIEELANVVKKNNNCEYGETKATRDLAAGAVLVVAIVSVIVGLIIFLPKIF
ncbi:MAG: diacylglycerol kinase family protein [Candidatus Shapirobacteria bacterium]